MTRNRDDRVRQLLRREIERLGSETVKADGVVDADRLQRVERLSTLVDAREAAQSGPTRRRWPIALLLLASLLAVSVLFFGRVSETGVALSVQVSELGFAMSDRMPLTDVTRLSAIGVSGAQQLSLPYALLEDPLGVAPVTALRLSLPASEVEAGSLTLSPLLLPERSRVRLRTGDQRGDFRLTIEAVNLQVQVDVHGKAHLATPGSPPTLLDFPLPVAVRVMAGEAPLDLDIATLASVEIALAPQLPVTALGLSRMDEFGQAGERVVRQISTVLSGSLWFESLDGQEYRLRPHEALAFDEVRGEILSLVLVGDKIDLHFQGSVKGMRIGAHEGGRSLMPTYLEWLRARHGLALLWGSTVYLFGIGSAVLRWWRRQGE